MKAPRVLFICKKRVDSYGVPIGLINSAKFVVNSLKKHGIIAELVSVQDNNSIHAEVVRFQPTHVMIEAIWVVPSKFYELLPLHPNVKWLVRIHSKTPFLSMEGIAMDWILKYNDISKVFPNFGMAPNSESLADDIKDSLRIKTTFLPNTYEPDCEPNLCHQDKDPKTFDIGCFGAIRPLKNHLIQALAAIQFAKDHDKKLRFHINANRIEQKGDDILRNLRALNDNGRMELVEHPWMPHKQFMDVIGNMDMGMQVSLSESFNIVAADFVYVGIPIVVSTDIDWMPWYSQACPTDLKDIVSKLDRSWSLRNMGLPRFNKWALDRHNEKAISTWLEYLSKKKN